MATNKIRGAWGGLYDNVKDRVYTVRRTALMGIIQWDEIVHTDRLENTRVLSCTTTGVPDKVYVDGVEYIPKS